MTKAKTVSKQPVSQSDIQLQILNPGNFLSDAFEQAANHGNKGSLQNNAPIVIQKNDYDLNHSSMKKNVPSHSAVQQQVSTVQPIGDFVRNEELNEPSFCSQLCSDSIQYNSCWEKLCFDLVGCCRENTKSCCIKTVSSCICLGSVAAVTCCIVNGCC